MRDGKARQLSEEEAEEADFARLQRWDAEIEAEFQRVVAATKTAGKANAGSGSWAHLGRFGLHCGKPGCRGWLSCLQSTSTAAPA